MQEATKPNTTPAAAPTKPSRRALFVADAPLIVEGAILAATVTAGATQDADADLIALCDQLLDVVARQEALYSVRRTIEDEERTEPQMVALFDERHDVAGRIMETPNARTNPGRYALVRAALAIAERDGAGEIVPRTKGAALAWMVVKSLASSAGPGPMVS